MPDSKQIIDRVTHDHAVSNRTSPTAAGRPEPQQAQPTAEHVDAINQVFALFRLNYHNQYYAAWPDEQQLNQIKRLWLEDLAAFPVAQILQGAKYAIDGSEYLPTLKRMRDALGESLQDFGLPAPRDAYQEACNAARPLAAQSWSHPAVYLAGQDCGWFFLRSNDERITWPRFRDCYERWCQRALAGEELAVPEQEALPVASSEPMSRDDQQAALEKLRQETGL